MTTNRRRRGSNLIECLVLVSTLSVLMGVAAVLVHRMLRVDQAERARGVAAAGLERLGRDLRDDARAAIGPAEVAGRRLVLPRGGGRSVEYLVRDREADVLRTVRLGDKAEHFETYRRPPGTAARFEATRDGPRAVVALVLSADPDAPAGKLADPSYRGARVEAVVPKGGPR